MYALLEHDLNVEAAFLLSETFYVAKIGST